MWNRAERARTILAVSCCLFVLLAATGHLLHAGHAGHHHGKAIADDACSLCVFGLTLPHCAYIPPQLSELSLGRLSFSDTPVYARTVIRVDIGRAPPCLTESPVS